jgi:hypothetical protein
MGYFGLEEAGLIVGTDEWEEKNKEKGSANQKVRQSPKA